MLPIFIDIHRVQAQRERDREDAKKRRLSVLHVYHQLKCLISEDGRGERLQSQLPHVTAQMNGVDVGTCGLD